VQREPRPVLAARSGPESAPEGKPDPTPAVRICDPLEVPGWDAQIARFPEATVFHTRGWCRVLTDSYGHRPVYLVIGKGDDTFEACLPILEVRSLLTGRRGISLPFTDFCPCLIRDPAYWPALLTALLQQARVRHWRYVELRQPGPAIPETRPSLHYLSHTVDLSGGPEAMLARMGSAARRNLRKAQTSGLQVEIANSQTALAAYYELHCLTRRRHGLPPQPWRFFQNIARYLLQDDLGMVVLVRKDQTVIAGAVFLHFGRQAVYKFGASDMTAQQWRPNNLAMWTAMRDYALRDFSRLHLGRTSSANEGLRRFKTDLGGREELLPVHCLNPATGRALPKADRTEGFRRLPLPCLRWAGKLLYPHMD
jgi:CelD/BcsL family acetyltransferase involved in cellulose biosynthesis